MWHSKNGRRHCRWLLCNDEYNWLLNVSKNQFIRIVLCRHKWCLCQECSVCFSFKILCCCFCQEDVVEAQTRTGSASISRSIWLDGCIIFTSSLLSDVYTFFHWMKRFFIWILATSNQARSFQCIHRKHALLRICIKRLYWTNNVIYKALTARNIQEKPFRFYISSDKELQILRWL